MAEHDRGDQVEREWARQLGSADLEQLRALLTRLAAVVAEPASSSAHDTKGSSTSEPF